MRWWLSAPAACVGSRPAVTLGFTGLLGLALCWLHRPPAPQLDKCTAMLAAEKGMGGWRAPRLALSLSLSLCLAGWLASLPHSPPPILPQMDTQQIWARTHRGLQQNAPLCVYPHQSPAGRETQCNWLEAEPRCTGGHNQALSLHYAAVLVPRPTHTPHCYNLQCNLRQP